MSPEPLAAHSCRLSHPHTGSCICACDATWQAGQWSRRNCEAAPLSPAPAPEPSAKAIKAAGQARRDWWVPETAQVPNVKRMVVEMLKAAYAIDFPAPLSPVCEVSDQEVDRIAELTRHEFRLSAGPKSLARLKMRRGALIRAILSAAARRET